MIENSLNHDTQSRLVTVRWLLLAIETPAVLGSIYVFQVRLPLAPMVLILALHGTLNLFAMLRRRSAPLVEPGEVFAELATDAAAIAGLVYFSGGYANPFISLLLVPLILCAVALPSRPAWAMTAWVGTLYSLLAIYYRPLTLEVGEQEAINLHLAGMWLNFLLTATLVAAFVNRLGRALHQREADLALAREQALRDEQLFALGMQAAAAAHDLATPLSSLRLSLKELERDYAGDDELGPSLSTMAGQAERMKGVLDRLAAAAGAARATGTLNRPLDTWLHEIHDHWGLMRPQVRVRLELSGPQPAPTVREEASLVSVLTTLLNNAADASPNDLTLAADWDERSLKLEVLDRGPGLALAGDKPEGWGVGLMLAQAALERLGGRVELVPRQGGGLVARIALPLSSLGAA